jgi:hypothetical protein
MSFSDFLFARGGFLSGVARTLELGGRAPLYNYAPTPMQADMLALYADWRTVGQDLRHGMACAARRVRAIQPALFDLDSD